MQKGFPDQSSTAVATSTLQLPAKDFRFSNFRDLISKVDCYIVGLQWDRAFFPFGEEKLVAPLIAIPNVDRANQRQGKGKRLN